MSETQQRYDQALQRAFEPRASSLRGLRNTVLAQLLLVALIPLVALALYLRTQFVDTLEERCRVLVGTVAQVQSDAIDRSITNKIAVLRNMATSGVIEFPPSKAQIEAVLAVLRGLDETILDIGLFDESGDHVRYAGPSEFLEGKNYRDEAWFKIVAASESGVYVSDVFRGYRGTPHFVVALRTVADGRRWYLRTTVHPARFTKMVDDIRIIDGANAFLVSSDGVIQAGPPEVGEVLSRAPSLPDFDGDDGVAQVSDGDRSYLAGWSRLSSTSWTLVVRQDLSVAYAPIYRAQRGVFLILAVGVVFIVGVSMYATRRLVRRYARAERDRAKLIEQLVQAGKMGTLGEMAAGVAHEINNPLAVVLSEVGVLEDSLDPALGGGFDEDQFRRTMNSIKHEVFRCRDITHKLLGFARFHEPRLDPCNPNDLVTEVVDLVRKELNLENIELRVETDMKMSEIVTDGEKIRQVLINLVRNAADAIGKDGRITIQTFGDAQTASIIVTDTGKGIPKDDLAKIFQPFFTTKEVGKGTGLGLAISHGIVTSLGGTLTVASEVGVGTSFEIRLPRQARRVA